MISGIRNSRLTELSLRNNQLSSSSGKHIAHILEPESDHTPAASAESLLFMPGSAEPTTRVAQLSILDLRDNRLSDGVVDIAQALAVNRRLKELSLRANQVDESGLLALVNALANNRALKSLDVSSNDVFSPHAPDLMTELKNILVTNPVLSNLILANTNLGTDDVITLAESLPIAKGLQALDVSYNPIGAAGVLSLAAAIKSNNSITSIDVFPILDTSWDNDESVLDSDLAAAVGIMEAVLSRNASNRPNKTEMVVRSLPSSFDPAQPASTPSLATASPGNFDPDELLTIAAMNTFSGSADDDMQEQDDNVRDLGKLRDSLTVAAKQQLYRRSQLHAAATNAPALSSTTREGSSTSSRASVGNGPQAVVLPPRKTSLQLSDSLQVLERRVAAAEETSTVFSDMLEMAQKQLTAELKPSLSQNELLKQLYDEAVHFQQKLQESLNNLDIYHEELMGKALAANDRLTQTRSQYDTLVGMRSASSLQDSVPTRPPLSRSQSQASMERLQKAQQQQASLSDMPAQLDVAKPSGAPAGGRRASKLLTIPEVSRTQPLEVMLLGSMSRGGSDEAITLGRLAGEDTQDVEDDPDHGSARPGNSTRGSSTLLLESSMAGSSLNSSSFNAMRRRLSTLENMFAGAASPMIADSVSSTVSTPASSSATQPPSLSSSLSSSALPSGRVGGHQRTLSAPHTHDQQQQQQQQQQKSRAANNRYSMGIRFTGEYASNGEFKSDFFESVEAALEKSAYDFKELLNRTDSSHEASIEQTALGSSAASSEPFMLLSLADLGLAGPTFQQSGDVPPVTAWKSIDLLNEGGSAAGRCPCLVCLATAVLTSRRP
ncbi:hypothetical protein BC831DRAFT_72819 [Entophlyctis helioformis]|nr:hypothetical protein BC831DRAFT_72819 [Entophlyctis helioformis]